MAVYKFCIANISYRLNKPAHRARVEQVLNEIEENGTYEMEQKELVFAAKLAWRNAARCIGRIQWNKLQVKTTKV